ncbi:Glycoside hydrolase 18 family enzyme, chitinase [Thermococcus sp. 2319x1]|nr:Glycoside hydrolase 18 family enzyme, chitinase [Thermococcus sp. 2319x1]
MIGLTPDDRNQRRQEHFLAPRCRKARRLGDTAQNTLTGLLEH